MNSKLKKKFMKNWHEIFIQHRNQMSNIEICQQEMTLIIVVQINIEKADKKKHLNNWNIKKNSEKKVLMMKNNKNNEYSETDEIINEKKSQILKCSTSHYADNYAAEKSDHHNNEYRNKKEHVIHVVSIMFNETDNDDCFVNIIKRWYEELM